MGPAGTHPFQGRRMQMLSYGVLLVAMALFVYLRTRETRVQLDLCSARAVSFAHFVAVASRPGLEFEDRTAVRDSLRAIVGDPELEYAVVQDGKQRPWAVYPSNLQPEKVPDDSVSLVIQAGVIHVRETVLNAAGEPLGLVRLGYSIRVWQNQQRAFNALAGVFLGLLLLGGATLIFNARERRRIHEQLLRAEQLSSIGRLAASVAHEINNPLAFIKANLGFAQESLPELSLRDPPNRELATEVRMALGEANHGVERVRRIVADLKTHARASSGEEGPTDVAAAVDAALKLVGNELKQRGRIELQIGSVPKVYASEGRLVQVFVNLLANATHALPERDPERQRVTVHAYVVRESVRIDVQDTGSGIQPEHLRRLFEPFFTTKPQGVGTGLGLYLCHSIVQSYGGTLEVESKLGKGSTFSVTLPIAREDATPEPLPLAPAPRSSRRGRVLVIDDEPALTRALRRSLMRRHDVVEIHGGRAALELLAKDSGFDVVLCDLMMPEMTGMDVYRAAAELGSGLERRFVFMTGGAFTTRGREFVEQSQQPVLEKPLELERLHALLSRFTEARASQGGPA